MARFDYTAVGHVTVDVLADGTRRPGGGAFYSALQAARLGLRAQIRTQGKRGEIEALLAPFAEEFALLIEPAAHTTTLLTSGLSRERVQRVLAWAGPMGAPAGIDTEILHLAPVARETSCRWDGRAGFVGLTPQGLVRTWSAPDGHISPSPLPADALPARCDAIVISEAERESCAWLFSRGAPAREPGAQAGPPAGAAPPLIAVTAAHAATTVHCADGSVLRIEVAPLDSFADDLGAGDVFAAAFFVALARGRDPAEAGAFANAAAAARIAGGGPHAIGDERAIERRLRARGAVGAPPSGRVRHGRLERP